MFQTSYVCMLMKNFIKHSSIIKKQSNGCLLHHLGVSFPKKATLAFKRTLRISLYLRDSLLKEVRSSLLKENALTLSGTEEAIRSYRWKLELMYLKCGNISIFILFNMYRKAMLGSLQYLPRVQRAMSSSIHQREIDYKTTMLNQDFESKKYN